jgi:hypothetical protein
MTGSWHDNVFLFFRAIPSKDFKSYSTYPEGKKERHKVKIKWEKMGKNGTSNIKGGAYVFQPTINSASA